MSETQHSDAGDLSRRPGAERAEHYRELADMHLEMATRAHDGEARAQHLELAALWTRLAAQAEHELLASTPDTAAESTDPKPPGL